MFPVNEANLNVLLMVIRDKKPVLQNVSKHCYVQFFWLYPNIGPHYLSLEVNFLAVLHTNAPSPKKDSSV